MESRAVTLRPANPADETFLLDLRRSTMTEHLERAGEPIDEKAHWERLRFRFNDAHIVCRGSERLGMFKFYRAPNVWTIVQIQIAPKHQGQGIAARLIGEFLEQADIARVPVMLSVLRGNRAINLYRRLGFQVVKTTNTSLEMRRG